MMIGAPVPSLVRWGRSPDADLVYRTLVTLGPAAARDLRQDLGITSKRVNQAIDELVSVGAIDSRPRRGQAEATWSAKPPAEVASTMRRARFSPGRHRTASPRERQAATSAVLPQPLILGDGLRHLVTRALTRERLVELTAATRHEFLSMNPEEVFEPEALRAAAPLDRRLVERGVVIHALGVQPPNAVPLEPRRRSPSARKGYRQALALPMKLIVYDRKVALFPVDPNNFERGYLEVAQPPVVSALVALFERSWASARDPREAGMPEVVLTSRERTLISLLAHGHTDVTAARELGISPRSVSSLVRDLMDRFQVNNRFQLGLALGTLRVVPLSGAADQTPGEKLNERS